MVFSYLLVKMDRHNAKKVVRREMCTVSFFPGPYGSMADFMTLHNGDYSIAKFRNNYWILS